MKQNQCPEFPFFGAPYPDARCIDGYLYDLDSCDENGNFYYTAEKIPCPFCNKNEFIKSFGKGFYNNIILRFGNK